MSPHVLLRDLAVVMIVAGIVTLVFHRLRQPVVLGYILAGVIIGPHTPPFPLVHDEASIKTLAELGVVFLMFSLGLHFSLRQLKAVGTTAFIAASLEILLMLWVGYEIGQWFGWSQMDSIFLGAILSISSTTIIVKALEELKLAKEGFARIIFGILIVEDILAIAMIGLLSSIAMTGGLQAGEVLQTVGRIGIFLVVALVLGLLSVPPLMRYVARFRSEEMLLVTVLGLCFGMSLLAVELGYSVALGAFVIGTIIGETREIGQIKRLTEPVRDTFSAVFFVAIGMLIEPRLLGQYAWPIVVLTVAVVVGKVATCSFGTFVAGHDTRTSLRVGMGLAQIGEFSFIIAALGLTLGVTSDFLYPIAVTVSAITTLLTPYLIKSSDPVVNWFDRAAPQWVVQYLALYSRWVAALGRGREHSVARRLIRSWTIQMGLNLMLVSGAFLVAVGLAPWAESRWPNLPSLMGGAKGVVWLVTTVVALPGLIAVVRKLRALALLLAEVNVTERAAGRQTAAIRAVVSQTIFLAGVVGIGLWTLVLSAALLPTGPELVWLVVVALVLAFVLWRFFVQIHARAQVTLRDVMHQPPPDPHHEETSATALRAAVLKDLELTTVAIAAGAPAAGRLIRELELRAQTGATAVAIDRDGGRVVNPGPDEELRPGDQVLLLGSPGQLTAGRRLLSGATERADA